MKKAKALLVDPNGEAISYGSISRGTGIHTTHLCKIFNGQRRPSLKTAAKIAGYLGIQIEQLNAALGIR